MKITISFKTASSEDIDFLLSLRQSSMDQHLKLAGINMTKEQHLARIHEYFEDSNLILINNNKIGVLKLGVFTQSLHIRQFQLMPRYQGQGIGKKVLEVVKKKALKLKKPITLNVLLENPAKSLYIRLGFKVIGENELEYQMKCSLADCVLSVA